MASIEKLVESYDAGHSSVLNKVLHVIGVLLTTMGLLSFLWYLPDQIIVRWLGNHPFANWATVYAVLMIIYFGSESFSLTFAGGIFYQGCLFGVNFLEKQEYIAFNQIILLLFLSGFILMFIGHLIQRNVPEFRKDILYLPISVTWIFKYIYRWIGIPF